MKYGKIIKIAIAVGFGFYAGKALYNTSTVIINKIINKFFKKKAKELRDNPNADEPRYLIDFLIKYGYLDHNFYLNRENKSESNMSSSKVHIEVTDSDIDTLRTTIDSCGNKEKIAFINTI